MRGADSRQHRETREDNHPEYFCILNARGPLHGFAPHRGPAVLQKDRP